MGEVLRVLAEHPELRDLKVVDPAIIPALEWGVFSDSPKPSAKRDTASQYPIGNPIVSRINVVKKASRMLSQIAPKSIASFARRAKPVAVQDCPSRIPQNEAPQRLGGIREVGRRQREGRV